MKMRSAMMLNSALVACGVAVWSIAAFHNPAAAHATPALSSSAVEMKPYTETIPGTNVKFDMVAISGGSFQMGSPAGEAHRNADEGPQHTVSIHPFWMGKTEVTWEEYDQFAFALGLSKSSGEKQKSGNPADAITRPTPPYADPTFGFGHDGYPAISMTHHAAMEYTRWLSAKTGKIYRLATEAEWEYACRAGAKTEYAFGDDPAKLDDEAWYGKNSGARPHPVGKKKPNAWGLYDMMGNVDEWVLDLYDKFYYKTFSPLVPADSPVLLPTEQEYPYVVRGGSWADDAPALRCAARRASTDDWSRQDPQLPQSIWWHTDATFVGFRIVRPLEEQENLKGFKSKVKKLE